MPFFRVVIQTVFEIDNESEYKARCEAFQAANKCQEETHDKCQVTSIGVESSNVIDDLVIADEQPNC